MVDSKAPKVVISNKDTNFKAKGPLTHKAIGKQMIRFPTQRLKVVMVVKLLLGAKGAVRTIELDATKILVLGSSVEKLANGCGLSKQG